MEVPRSQDPIQSAAAAATAAPSGKTAIEADSAITPLGRPSPLPRFRLRTSGIEATSRLLSWGIRSLLRRGRGRLASPFQSTSVRQANLEEARRRERIELVRHLGLLKGAFTKAGQFASLRVDLADDDLRGALTSLQDRVPALPIAQIEAVVEAELGAPIGQLFSRFESQPLGAASIAQVHRAQLADGSEVAVKVQYPWIGASLPADLAIAKRALSLAMRFSAKSLPDRDRLFEEFGESLKGELDFRREASIAAEIAQNLAADPQILVPEVVRSHSSARVLTMRYVDAVGIADRQTLLELGVDPGEVLKILARAYAKQVFKDGLFHADPHPGNLFVVREATADSKPRVLFVDFGLSRRLDADLRREMRKGIYALLQRDLEGFLSGMDALGMIAPGARTEVEAAVGKMFARIAEGGGAMGIGNAQVLSLKDEAKELLSETPGIQLPTELLLYAKTVTYLFSLGELLDPKVDLMKLTLPHLLGFLAQREEAGETA